MSELHVGDFPAYFEAIHGSAPFPWQRMLVEEIVERGWPQGIDLPTASGKTACIDVAVFLLALGEREGRLEPGHAARRRVFFVVDRRIVVDEAHERAQKIAAALETANDGPVRMVADRLRRLAWEGSEVGAERTPLVASRLRGGTVHDDRWRLSPAQPAIVTGTVDQIGSRLLFRSYGSGPLSTPIEAALTACDSLILLDEAHCAVPFLQTAEAVTRLSGAAWCDGEPVVAPMTLSIMSATPPGDLARVFPPAARRAEALDHARLRERIEAAKPALLVECPARRSGIDGLVHEAVARAKSLVARRSRIAVMVNRVATAGAVAAELRRRVGDAADVVLMTGRMRPIERDLLITAWKPFLRSGSDALPARPIIVVTTQCLEVGADFSFDALITECASFDALRQRFGRLNRLGLLPDTDAAILARKPDVAAKADDPIYGTALRETWAWLSANASPGADGPSFDFGIAGADAALPDGTQERAALSAMLSAPAPDAPVLLPAHLDMLCQTAPRPLPEPEVSLFLHGPQRVMPEVRIVFRADLVDLDESRWNDAISLLPPLTSEALTVPLFVARKWLAGALASDDVETIGDVEGQRAPETEEGDAGERAFLIWRGGESMLGRDPGELRPNETIVVPAEPEWIGSLEAVHAFCRIPGAPLDLAEPAYRLGRRRAVLRLGAKTLDARGSAASSALVSWALAWSPDSEPSDAELASLLEALGRERRNEAGLDGAFLAWLPENAVLLAGGLRERSGARRPRLETHPGGGVVLIGPMIDGDAPAALDLSFGDVEDGLSGADHAITLEDHSRHVATRAEAWASRCLSTPLRDVMVRAAMLHDLGKADPRFQVLLHGDELEAAVALANERPIAKGRGVQNRPDLQRRLRASAGLPRGFRHEMLSVQLAASVVGEEFADPLCRDLLLHLIASHHGHARPFAPVVLDSCPPAVRAGACVLDGAARREAIPAHRIDSGIPDRFWRLVRRYGWWGLAYLEAVLRLADHAASAAEAVGARDRREEARR